MVESGLLVGQLVDSALQQSPQSLPAAQVKDVERFHDIISSSGDSTMSIQPQSQGDSVLQITEPLQEGAPGSLADSMINQAAQIDGTYHSLLSDLSNRTNFDSYFENTGGKTTDEMLTYPSVSSTEAGEGNPYETILERVVETQRATGEFRAGLNDWTLQFQIWKSGISIVSAAAKQVSEGFKTLFRASG
uniref:Uncharacterized protein n=1 Tax=uncultured Thiotrichaceae bacterium TaxID=298394 RepID=A0A6S6UGK9_9GAMM|nr:MAG: Unknown protein [uncultured Thiotrichaceae bacterium]